MNLEVRVDRLGNPYISLVAGLGVEQISFKASPALQIFSKSLSCVHTFHHQYCFALFFLLSFIQMFGRFNQLARHLSRPLPNYAHRSAAAIASTMTSLSTESGRRMIRTAGCIIIGDEVLGGKVP
jgi:hypothetical protein